MRKAFDSVWQESMEDMVAASGRAANRRRGTGNVGGMPWEARAWLGLLEAREVSVAMGDQLVQGSPDSPVLTSGR